MDAECVEYVFKTHTPRTCPLSTPIPTEVDGEGAKSRSSLLKLQNHKIMMQNYIKSPPLPSQLSGVLSFSSSLDLNLVLSTSYLSF